MGLISLSPEHRLMAHDQLYKWYMNVYLYEKIFFLRIFSV